MHPMRSALLSLCLVLFPLLAACSGSGEQPPQPQPPQQVARRDTTTTDILKTLEERYPGYGIKHHYTEYIYEVDSSAPIIHSKVESWVRDDLELIVYRHTEIRECRSAMDSLPKNIQEYMNQRNIVIPGFRIKQSYHLNNNVYLKGQFNQNDMQDWAVICYKDGYCWITVFWDGETADTSIVNHRPIAVGDSALDVYRTMLLLENDRDTFLSYDDLGFFTSLYSSYNYYLWPQSSQRPASFSHEGFAEKNDFNKGYYYYYFDNGRLLTWGNAMPGWEKWHRMNMKTMQDSLLLDPLLCEDIPRGLAEKWQAQGLKLTYIGDNPWCITGEFLKKGQTNHLVWLFSPTNKYPDPTFDLTLITSDTTYSIYSLSGTWAIRSFKHLRYCKIAPEQVTYMYHDNLEFTSTPLLVESDSTLSEPDLSPPFDHDGFFLGELDQHTFQQSTKPYAEEYMIYINSKDKWLVTPRHSWKHFFSDLL